MTKSIKINMISSLLIALSIICGTNIAKAQTRCAATPNCATLGFTKDATKCDTNFAILKCPTDTSKVFCKDKVTGPTNGDIYYSDGSFNSEVVSGKIAIGVVFDGMNRLVIALNETQRAWNDGTSSSSDIKDIPDLNNFSSGQSALTDIDGKENTKKIIAFQKSEGKVYQAADYCYNYSTVGTSKGEWFLPGLGQLKQLYDNKAIVNAGLKKLGRSALQDSDYWSSSETDYNYQAWLHGGTHGVTNHYSFQYRKNYNYYVRPVLAF